MNTKVINQNKKSSLLTLFLVLGLLLLIFIPQVSFAFPGEPLALQALWSIVNGIFGNLVWLAGKFLDYTITHYVIGFGFYYTNNGLGAAVDILWTTVRDIFNLTFIFGLVFIGFKMILNSSDNTAKKSLGLLIMAALLVNFSLFFTKAVVDFSNIAAKQFVQGYEKPKGSNEYSIGGTLMDHLSVQTVWSTQDRQDLLSWGYIFGALYLYIISAFIFLAGAILLLIRFVALNIYMLLSPVMFIGWVFPGFIGVTKKYWEGFLGQAFFAPAYFAMIYLTFEIIAKLKAGLNINEQNVATALGGVDYSAASQSFGGILMFFFVACAFMIAALVVAKKMGAVGATTAVSLGKKTSNWGRRMAVGTAAAGTRSILDRAARNDGQTTRIPVVRQLRQLARTTARGATMVGARGVLDDAAKPIDAGRERWKKNRAGLNQRDDEAKDAQKVVEGQRGEEYLARLRTKQKTTTPLTLQEQADLLDLEKAEAAMLSVIASMATSQLENMSARQLAQIAPHLTNSQVENIMKSDKIDPKTKTEVSKARVEAIEKIIKSGGTILTKELTKLSIDQIETMGDSWIRDNVHLFSNTQMEDLKKSKKFTESQKNSYAADRTGWHKAAIAGTAFKGKPTNPSELVQHTAGGGRRKPIDIANLDREILVDAMTPAFLIANPTFLTKDVLEVISEKKTLGATDRARLQQNIDDAYTATGYAPGPLRDLINYFSSPRVVANGF